MLLTSKADVLGRFGRRPVSKDIVSSHVSNQKPRLAGWYEIWLPLTRKQGKMVTQNISTATPDATHEAGSDDNEQSAVSLFEHSSSSSAARKLLQRRPGGRGKSGSGSGPERKKHP